MRLLRRAGVYTERRRSGAPRNDCHGFTPPFLTKKKFREAERAGFTFMELLIALTIFAVIASSLYYTLSGGIKVYRRGNVLIRDNQKLRIFFDTISLDLRNAVSLNREEASSKGKPASYTTEQTKFQIEAEWLEDKVSFSALVNTFSEDNTFQELAKISYHIEKDPRKNKRLVRKIAKLEEGFDEEFAAEKSFLEDLEDFLPEKLAFEYSYKEPGVGFDEEYEWRGEEFEDALPRGVKIILTLKNKTRNTEEEFTQTVFIPMGKLGSDKE